MSEEFEFQKDIKYSRKNYKKAIIIIIVVMIILTLGVLGFWSWKKYNEKQKNLQTLQEQVDNLKKEIGNLNIQFPNQNNQTDSATEAKKVKEEKRTNMPIGTFMLIQK